MNDYFNLIVASLFLLIGYIAKSIRWRLLFPPKSIKQRLHLLAGTSFSSTINFILPFRIGELFRLIYVSKKTASSWSHVYATLIAERLSDLIVLSIILSTCYIYFSNELWLYSAMITISITLFYIVTLSLIKNVAHARKAIWYITSVFNSKIQMSIINSLWTASEFLFNLEIFKTKYLASTILMWLSYTASLYFFTLNIDLLPSEISSFLSNTSLDFENLTEQLVATLIFIFIPLILTIIYMTAKINRNFFLFVAAQKNSSWYYGNSNHNIKNKFSADKEYEFFLASLFSGDNYATTEFGLNAVSDSTVIRLFNGGSDAITALVSVDNKLMIRKFATNTASKKLLHQYEWIAKHQNAAFPLVRLVQRSPQDDPFYYDMPLVIPASDYFDFIHTNPITTSMNILDQVCDSIGQHHKQFQAKLTNSHLIEAYLKEKVVANVKTILDFVQEHLGEESFTINGKLFDMRSFNFLLDIEWLKQQIKHTLISEIHGDLTIENIIIAPNTQTGWYIIDPNSENIFNTPLIDWAKLFQSLHLGYESMNRNPVCHIEDDAIRLPISKSEEYSLLFRHLEQKIVEEYGSAYVKEVYFHELVNYLRLTPYKIRQDKHKGLCFFAATCLLLNNYLENTST